MYIWDITCEVEWSSSVEDGENWVDSEDYTICAEDFDKAIVKIKKLVLSPSRIVRNTDEAGNKVSFKPINIDDITKVERKDWLDG